MHFYQQFSTAEKCLFWLINEVIHIIHIGMNQVVKSYCKLNERLFCIESRKSKSEELLIDIMTNTM